MLKVLKQRLITAVIFIVLLVGAILLLPNFYFSLLIGLLLAIGAWEWAALIGMPSVAQRFTYLGMVLVALWAAAHVPLFAVLLAACIGWLMALVWICRFPVGSSLWDNKFIGSLAGIFVLVPPWLALVEMHGDASMGPYLVLFLLAMTWLADSAAYFAGRRWGTPALRLAPRVSPGKTWAGVGGAAVAVTAYAFASGIWVFTGAGIVLFVLWCLLTLGFSIVGDLLESMFKRQAGVKDSGRLLPGHGGMLDRIDSLTAAAPVFMLGLMILNRGLQ